MLITELRQAFHGGKYEPIGQVADNRNDNVVPRSRHRTFFPTSEQFFQCAAHQRFGLHRNADSQQQTAHFVGQVEQRRVDGSRRNGQHMHAVAFVFVPQGFRKIEYIGFAGVVALYAGHGHPCGHRTHIQNVAVPALAHLFAKEFAEFGECNHVQHQQCLQFGHRCLCQFAENENAGVVYQNIDFDLLLFCKVEQLLGGVLVGQIGAIVDGGDVVVGRQARSHFVQLLCLIAHQQKVVVIVACQLRGVVHAHARRGSCNECKHILFLEFSDVFHSQEDAPIGQMFEQRQYHVVDDARHIRFLLFEHFFQCAAHQFFGRDAYRQVDGHTAPIVAQAEQCRIDGAWCHHCDAYAVGLEFVPQRFAQVVDERFGGVVCLYARHRHPRRHRRHVQDVAVAAPAHIFAEQAAHFGHCEHVQVQHQFDAAHVGLDVRIEEKDAGVVYQNIDLQAVFDAEIV